MTDARDPRLEPDMLSAYLDDELDAATRAAVAARLETSSEWRSELADVRAARDAVRGLAARDAPPGFWDAVAASVTADAAADPATDSATDAPTGEVVHIASGRRKAVRWLVTAAAAVVAVVVAAVIVPGRARVSPNVAAVVAQHGAQSSEAGDPISTIAPVGPLAGFRR